MVRHMDSKLCMVTYAMNRLAPYISSLINNMQILPMLEAKSL
jgi:hypothetical protein